MNRIASPAGAVLRINTLLLGAVLLAATAWAIWPSSPEWWGFGLLSIFLGMATIAALIDAFRTMVKLHERQKIIARMEATARPAEQTEFADIEALKKAGMIDE
jgi:glucose dehydrogenase